MGGLPNVVDFSAKANQSGLTPSVAVRQARRMTAKKK